MLDPKYVPSLIRFVVAAIAVVVIALCAPSATVSGAFFTLVVIALIVSN